jgi:hypothetical protein
VRGSPEPKGGEVGQRDGQEVASATMTIGAYRCHLRLQRHRAARAARGAVRDLIKSRLAGLVDEPGAQILLERLTY